jgi:hypothetical protein
MKQTAVQWLWLQIGNFPTMENLRTNIDKLLEQAKEMEQVEKIKAQIEAVRAVDTYGLIHMLKYYEQQLKELTLKNK